MPASRRTPPAVSAPPRSAPDGYANISDDSDHEHHGQSFYEGSGGSRGRRAPGQPSARARASVDRDPERPFLPESLTAEQKKLFNNFEDGIAHGKDIRDEEDAAQALGEARPQGGRGRVQGGLCRHVQEVLRLARRFAS